MHTFPSLYVFFYIFHAYICVEYTDDIFMFMQHRFSFALPLCVLVQIFHSVYMCRSQRVSTLNVLERKKKHSCTIFIFTKLCTRKGIVDLFLVLVSRRQRDEIKINCTTVKQFTLYASAEHMRMQICNTFNDENYSLLYEICGRLHSMHSYLINMGHDFSKIKSFCHLYISQSIF